MQSSVLTAHDLAEVLSVPPSQGEALPLLVSRLRVDPVGQQQRPSDGGGQGPTSRALWAGRPGCRDGEPAGHGHTGLCSTLCLQACRALPAPLAPHRAGGTCGPTVQPKLPPRLSRSWEAGEESRALGSRLPTWMGPCAFPESQVLVLGRTGARSPGACDKAPSFREREGEELPAFHSL